MTIKPHQTMAPDNSNSCSTCTDTQTQTHTDENDIEEENENDALCTISGSNRENEQGEDKTWQQRFRQWFVNNKNEGGAAALAATVLLSVSAFAFYKFRRRSKQLQQYSGNKMVLWPLLFSMFRRPEYQSAVEVSLSLLKSMAVEGQIGRALVGPSDIYFQDKNSTTITGSSWKRSMLPKNSPSIQSELMDILFRGGCTEVSALPDSVWSRIAPAILTALPFVYLALMYKILKNANGNDMSSKLLSDNQRRGRQGTKFCDVAGINPSIMLDMKDIVSYLKDPTSFNSLGAKPPRGLLLYGPPGAGKTLISRAIAGEADCDAFVSCCGSEFCEMYVGRGASRIRSVFQEARSTAKRRHYFNSSSCSWLRPWKKSNSNNISKRPATAILFIDELDALAKSRSYDGITGNDERDQTLNQLLTEMDGFSSSQEDEKDNVIVIVIAATNREDVLDPAIIRRFDRRIHIPYPDQAGRRDILKIHAKRTACSINDIDWDSIAMEERTGNFSGSDLRALVNDATLLAVRQNSPTVTQSHYNHALRRLRAMKAASTATPGSSLFSSNQPTFWNPSGNHNF